MLHIQIVYQKDIGYFYAFLVRTVMSTEAMTPLFILLQIHYF